MDVYIADDSCMTIQKRQAFESHCQNCHKCAREYEESKFIIAVVRKYWPIGENALVLMKKSNQTATSRMTVEQGWQDLARRCPDLAQLVKHRKRLRLFYRVSAVAACLVIGVLVWRTSSFYSAPESAAKHPAKQVALESKPSVRVELESKNGRHTIGAKQKIHSADELKTLVINGKHRLIMNTNTILTIEPLLENVNIGCLVKLDSGRIYAHVEHDGNPFVVDTARGDAVITGTTFDVKVTDDSTTLVVSEGTVQFGLEKGIVKVPAGRISEIIGQTAPSNPISCNVAALTAWATGYKAEPGLTEGESCFNTSEFQWLWPIERVSTGLGEIDYNCWLKKKRNWFRMEFPWIFQLQSALAREGVEVEYSELLIKSGDLWRFAYMKTRPGWFSVFSFDSLIKTASEYGFDRHWILKNVAAAKYALQKPLLPGNSLTVLNAFEQWNGCFENAQKLPAGLDYDTLYHLFYASTYLTETRSMIWFSVKSGKGSLTDNERAELMAMLQEEVNAAGTCRDNALYQPYKEKQLCEPDSRKENKWCQWGGIITRNIKVIMRIETKMAEYEVTKCDLRKEVGPMDK